VDDEPKPATTQDAPAQEPTEMPSVSLRGVVGDKRKAREEALHSDEEVTEGEAATKPEKQSVFVP
jgi:hypothetical protein